MNNLYESRNTTNVDKGKQIQSTYQLKNKVIKETPKKDTVIKKETITKTVTKYTGAGDAKDSYTKFKTSAKREKSVSNKKSGIEGLSKTQIEQTTNYKSRGNRNISNTKKEETFTGRNSNSSSKYEYNQKTEYKKSSSSKGALSSQFEIIDDEYIIVNCPVHGRQTIRRDIQKRIH